MTCPGHSAPSSRIIYLTTSLCSLDSFHNKPSCRAARGSTTHESQMTPCLRHSAICRRYVYVTLRSALNACRRHAAPRFTFCLRRSTLPLRSVLDKRHWRLAPALIPSCRQMSAQTDKRACPSARPLAGLS